MRSRRAALDLAPRTGAGIDALVQLERIEHCGIAFAALRLSRGQCIPIETEPAQVFDGLSRRAQDLVRGVSRSSTRSNSSPPRHLASSHATKKVLAFPTCWAPVGEGANRPRYAGANAVPFRGKFSFRVCTGGSFSDTVKGVGAVAGCSKRRAKREAEWRTPSLGNILCGFRSVSKRDKSKPRNWLLG
jgi:hypothetical protein